MTVSQPIHKIFAQKILNKKEFLASNPTVADILDLDNGYAMVFSILKDRLVKEIEYSLHVSSLDVLINNYIDLANICELLTDMYTDECPSNNYASHNVHHIECNNLVNRLVNAIEDKIITESSFPDPVTNVT